MLKNGNGDTTKIIASAANAAANAADNASQAAALAARNAEIAAKAAAESATAIAVVATDTSWMKKSLEGIEITLDSMSKAFVTAVQHQEVIRCIDDHENRIRNIEQNMWKMIGATGVIASIITVAIGIIMKLFVK